MEKTMQAQIRPPVTRKYHLLELTALAAATLMRRYPLSRTVLSLRKRSLITKHSVPIQAEADVNPFYELSNRWGPDADGVHYHKTCE